MTTDNIKSPEGVSKEEILNSVLKKHGITFMDAYVFKIDAIRSPADTASKNQLGVAIIEAMQEYADTLATSLPPVEGVSDEEIGDMAPELGEHGTVDRIKQTKAWIDGATAMRDKLQSHLSILSLENKELKAEIEKLKKQVK